VLFAELSRAQPEPEKVSLEMRGGVGGAARTREGRRKSRVGVRECMVFGLMSVLWRVLIMEERGILIGKRVRLLENLFCRCSDLGLIERLRYSFIRCRIAPGLTFTNSRMLDCCSSFIYPRQRRFQNLFIEFATVARTDVDLALNNQSVRGSGRERCLNIEDPIYPY
jgi:hypothetical protein